MYIPHNVQYSSGCLMNKVCQIKPIRRCIKQFHGQIRNTIQSCTQFPLFVLYSVKHEKEHSMQQHNPNSFYFFNKSCSTFEKVQFLINSGMSHSRKKIDKIFLSSLFFKIQKMQTQETSLKVPTGIETHNI